MPDTDPQRLADQREREVDQLQQRSDELASEVSDVSQDWHRKRSDQGVPGAQPHDLDDADEEPDEDAAASKADKGGEG